MKEKENTVSQSTSRTRNKSRKGTKPSRKPRSSKLETKENNPASERFVKDLLVRGEAAKPDAEGNLPLDATHVLTKENEDGTAEVKRARYKYY